MGGRDSFTQFWRLAGPKTAEQASRWDPRGDLMLQVESKDNLDGDISKWQDGKSQPWFLRRSTSLAEVKNPAKEMQHSIEAQSWEKLQGNKERDLLQKWGGF